MTTFDPDTGVSSPPAIDPSTPVTPPPTLSRRRSTAVTRATVAFAVAVAFVVGVGIGRMDLGPAGIVSVIPGASAAPGDEFALIREAWDTIHKNYVDAKNLDDRKLAYGAIDGMTNAVGDTGHTTFMTPEARAARNSALSGSYVGIGAEVDTTADGLPLIVGVFRGSPADKAGLKAGDIVVAVDGKSTTGESVDSVIARVRGEAGTPVVLTVRSGADGPVRDVRIIRADVQIEPVSWAMVPGSKTAMLRLEQFSSGAGPKLKAALEEIRAAGADRLIFDLRGNPGGYVSEAVVVASQFLASGNVYIERNAAGEEKATAVATGGVAVDQPLVVLVDNGSASAAEIVAGAVQDAGRAKLVGEKTFGTGTVLGEFPLSDGSALRIGTVEWLTPKGRVIWHAGIPPDVVVARPAAIQPVVPDDLKAMSAADLAKLADPQVKRAIELLAAAP